MATLDQQAYPDDECDGCEFHRGGLQLVAALFAKLDELEQRIAALEARERARHRRRAA